MTTAANTHLVIADDHPLFRDALRQAVESVVASAVVSEAGSFDDLTALLERDSDVDLILLDLTMPGISGFSGLIYLRAQYPAIPVVIVSASDDAGTIRRSLDFGASGFIPKRFGVETLRDAIMKVMEGDVWVPPDTDLTSADDPDMARLRDRLVTLTPQQVRVLMMLSEGLLNKQIAYELGVSEATIKAHVRRSCRSSASRAGPKAVIAAAKIAGGQWRQGTPTGSSSMSGSGRALLFDIDGTLADTDALHLKHSIKCSGLYGQVFDRDRASKELMGFSNRSISERFLPGQSPERQAAIMAEKEEAFRKLASGQIKRLAGLMTLLAMADRADVPTGGGNQRAPS
jgi:DNA-binding NarL/FixJ family response regulator